MTEESEQNLLKSVEKQAISLNLHIQAIMKKEYANYISENLILIAWKHTKWLNFNLTGARLTREIQVAHFSKFVLKMKIRYYLAASLIQY